MTGSGGPLRGTRIVELAALGPVLAAVMLHARHIQVDPMLFAIAYVVVTGAIALVIDARNLRNAAIAYLVPLAGGLLMFGIFARTNIALNPATRSERDGSAMAEVLVCKDGEIAEGGVRVITAGAVEIAEILYFSVSRRLGGEFGRMRKAARNSCIARRAAVIW